MDHPSCPRGKLFDGFTEISQDRRLAPTRYGMNSVKP